MIFTRYSLVTVVAVLCGLTEYTAAHQNLHEFYVNGVSVGYEKCMRRPPSNSPVTDINSNDIRCNVNGLLATGTNPVPGVCAAKAGDEITVVWDTSSHPGPLQHFLYGPVSNALTADGSGAKWFKIHELSVQNGKMANVLMMENAGKWSFRLPANLETGEYLLRSEMLALHGAQTIGGAQFYIGCMQLRITGPGGNCSPKFALPGRYSPTETAIYIPNNYAGHNTLTYTAPGGPTATCAPGSNPPVTSVPSSSSPTTSTVRPPTTTATPTPTPTGAVVQKYGQCGGNGYTGATNCVSGTTCTKLNDFYSQCL